MQVTPFYPLYQKYGAKLIEFFGWNLPVQFAGIIAEHLTVRQRVGLFDVSHMGELLVQGPEAPAFLDYVFTNSIASLQPGFVRYSPLCWENGGTVDDVLIYRLAEQRFLLVVNASNTGKDHQWLTACAAGFRVELDDISDATAQLAVQGPAAAALLADVAGPEITRLKYYQFAAEIPLGTVPVLISRTGYTGEDGFEIYLPPAAALAIWEMIMTAGQKYGIQPIGLGARDTLRLEAGLSLYGHELTDTISPLEAGLSRFIDFSKDNFIGKSALQNPALPVRRLIGLEMVERGVPRAGYPVFAADREVGSVTSGGYAPFLEKNLAVALIRTAASGDPRPDEGSGYQIGIREKRLAARIIPFPFYKRPRQKGASQ